MSKPPELQQIPLGDIEHPSPFQTRRFTDGAGVAELAGSIRQVGVLEPILVRSGTNGRPFQLLAGERRLRAASEAGLDAIPAIVRDLDDDAALEVTVTENLHREDLHPLDEAAAIEMLLQRYEDPKEVAARIGRPLSFVARRSRLTTLTEAWRNAVEYRPPAPREINMGEPCRECGDSPEDVPVNQWVLPDLCLDCADGAGIRCCRYCGCTDEMACDEGCEWVEDDVCSSCQEHDDALDLSSWGVTHLEAIARLEPADQDDFLEHGISRWQAPRMTAAQLEADTAACLRKLSAAPWSCSDAELLPEAGACTKCPMRASVNPGLFDDVEEGKGIPAGDRCLSASCWDRKLAVHIAVTLDDLAVAAGEKPQKFTTKYDRRKEALYDDWNVTTSDKPKEGYKPAVRIDGPQAGHVVYVSTSSTSGRSTVQGDKPEKTPAEKLRDGQERLDRRRLKLANESIVQAIEATGKSPKPRDVWALVACAGCTGRTAYHANELPRHYDGSEIAARAKDAREKAIGNVRFTWTAFEQMSTAAYLNAGAELVWHESVWPHIKARCEYSSHRDPKTQHQELCAVADLVKVDHLALTQAATDEVPEPKSWAKLREQIKLEKADAKKAKKRGKEAAAA